MCTEDTGHVSTVSSRLFHFASYTHAHEQCWLQLTSAPTIPQWPPKISTARIKLRSCTCAWGVHQQCPRSVRTHAKKKQKGDRQPIAQPMYQMNFHYADVPTLLVQRNGSSVATLTTSEFKNLMGKHLAQKINLAAVHVCVINKLHGTILCKQVETQATNQQQCDHGRWPEANVGWQYRKGPDRSVHQM